MSEKAVRDRCVVRMVVACACLCPVWVSRTLHRYELRYDEGRILLACSSTRFIFDQPAHRRLLAACNPFHSISSCRRAPCTFPETLSLRSLSRHSLRSLSESTHRTPEALCTCTHPEARGAAFSTRSSPACRGGQCKQGVSGMGESSTLQGKAAA